MATAAPASAAAAGNSVDDLEAQIRDVSAKITIVEGEIVEVKLDLRGKGWPTSQFDDSSAVNLSLMDHLKGLMEEKRQLRNKEAILLERQQAAGELLLTG